MKITILDSVEKAGQARGLIVVIDVFRAFTTACYVFANGAEKIIPVADIKLAYKLKKENPHYILMGERDGYIQPGFDFGNSPSRILDVDFANKTVVLTTSNGTQGLVGAKNAEEIITGGFVNAGACVKYIQEENAKEVSLLCTAPTLDINEDIFCAQYIKSRIIGKKIDFEKMIGDIKTLDHSRVFFDPEILSHPIEDFPLSTVLDKFDFILKVEDRHEGSLYLKKVEIL